MKIKKKNIFRIRVDILIFVVIIITNYFADIDLQAYKTQSF